jgi:hypothetical protein
VVEVLISEFMDRPTADSWIADYDVHWDPDLLSGGCVKTQNLAEPVEYISMIECV